MIYFIRHIDNGRIKIGTTARLSQRLRELAAEHGDGLTVLAIVDGSRPEEQTLHRRFAHLRAVNEWFEPGDDLVGFIVAEGREWDGIDEVPIPLCAKIDAEVLKMVRLVAEYRGVTAAEYLTEVVRPIVERDLKQEMDNFRLPRSEQPRKGKGGAK